ncbi:MAG: PLP-dependent aminotransferase family protein [Candidatus Dormiibacterota bacterium]|jgi:GntR family transcriptional regulator/MocR family aminotransferase
MANSEQKNWATSGLDLFLHLDDRPGGGLRVGVENGLREAIRSGRLPRGTRLPPTRALARDLGISRGTVLQAYDQLAAEGWLEGRQGSSTVVSAEAEAHRRSTAIRQPPPVRWRYDLRPGRPDASSFPRGDWLRALRRALATAPNAAFGYGSPQGQLSLRVELAGYLSRARGLRVSPESVVVTAGFTQGLGLVARSLAAMGVGAVAMEEPSMPLHRSIVRATGLTVVLMGVDGDGMQVEALGRSQEIGAAVLTPNRQHPTGVTLSATRRAQLLGWARRQEALIVEDDYDGEFRYEGHPIGPLQGLDPDLVVYAGTVSKTLAPGVRLGWLVLPERLRQHVLREKELADWQSSTLEQLALAEMLHASVYDRHVRRMRLRYRRRRDILVNALAEAFPGTQVMGIEAGLNVVIPLPDSATEARALAAAGAVGVGLEGLVESGLYERQAPAGLVVGYAAAPEHSFVGAVEALVSALHSVRG